MPLPDAPPPKTSRVYQQFAGKLLSTISSTNFDTVKDPVYIDRNSEDEIRRLNLIGQATNMQSQSGPMPETSKVVSTGDLADTGTVSVFRPEVGEVWQLMAMSLDPNGSNAAHRGIGYLVDFSSLTNPADPTNLSNAKFVEIFDVSLSTSAESLTYDTPLYLDRNTYFALNVVTLDTAAGDTLALKIACIRVR